MSEKINNKSFSKTIFHIKCKKRWIDILFIICFSLVICFEILCLIYCNCECDASACMVAYDEGTFGLGECSKTCSVEGWAWLDSLLNSIYDDGCVEAVLSDIKNILTTISTIIFPLVVMVLGISISASKEEIYGLSVVRFRRLNIKSKYTLTGMIILAISFIAGSVFFYFISFTFALLVLNVFAVIYSIYFIWQEVPILTRNATRLHKIIIFAYDFYTKNPGYGSGEGSSNINDSGWKTWSNDLSTAIGYDAYEEGFQEAVSFMMKETNPLVVLDAITEYYTKTLEIEYIKHEENAATNIVKALDAVEYYFERVKTFEYGINQKRVTFSDAGIVNLLFWLMDVLDENKLTDKYSTRITNIIFYNIIPSANLNVLNIEPSDKKPKVNKLAVGVLEIISYSVLAKSIGCRKKWYLNYVLEYIKLERKKKVNTLFDDYFLFASILLYAQPSETKKYFKSFINNKYWIEYISSLLLIKTSKCNGVYYGSELLKIILSVSNNFAVTLNNKLRVNYGDVADPGNKFIVGWWLLLAILNRERLVSSDGYTQELKFERFNKKEIDLIGEALEAEWKSTRQQKKQIKKYMPYFDHYGLSISKSAKDINVVKLDDSIFTTEDADILQSIKPLKDNKNSDKFFTNLEKVITDNKYYSSSIQLNRGSKVKAYFCNYVEDNPDKLISDYQKNLISDIFYESFINCLRDEMSLVVDDELMNSVQSVVYLLMTEDLNLSKGFQFAVHDESYKFTSISFNAKINKNQSSFAELDAFEVNSYLNSHYLKGDNRYHYKNGNIYQTLDELKEAIGSTFYRASVCILYNVELHLIKMEQIFV